MTKELYVDIDRVRVREIAEESLRIIHEHVGGEYLLTKEDVMTQVDVILRNSRVGWSQFYVKVGSLKVPDLELRIDPRRRKVLCKSGYKSRVAGINKILRTL